MKTSSLNISTLAFSKNQAIIGLVLLAVMLMTRVDHFGSAIKLPDASLAVFFLAGLYLRQWKLFPLYLVTAGIIDYVVTHYQGTSDFCVTPAYMFLIPTYAVMWFAGRGATAYVALRWINLACVANWVFAGTLAAFFISNTSFYFLSGYIQNFNLMQYVNGVVLYLPHYVGFTLVYVGLAAIIHVVAKLIVGIPEQEKAKS